MGYIYLIGEIDKVGTYKIGVTKRNNVNDRKLALQTGNSIELFICHTYPCDKPYALEKMLHRHFTKQHLINEWFELSEEDVLNFINTCEKYNDIIKSLKNNPFFK